MLENSDQQPLDCEATIIGERQSDLDATLVSQASPNINASGTAPDGRDTLPKRSTPSNEASSAAIVSLINKFLAKAVEKQATHVYIDPEENFLSIRYRHGESLQPLIDPLPQKFITPIISQLKLMAGLDLDRHETPQKGRIRKRGGGRIIHFFVETQPSFYREKLIIRVLDSAIKPPNLAQLIADDAIRQSLEPISHQDSGLLLISHSDDDEPASLLYRLLSQETLNPQTIATVESSIRYILPDITQIETDPAQEQDYADVLQSLLSKDKRRIMIDRLPNPSVARMVAEMAREQHFIITSLQANDAFSAIRLLSDMVTPNLLADTLQGVLHQYTLRRLCPTCRTVHQPSSDELKQFGIPLSKAQQVTFYQARCLNEAEIEQASAKGRLCRHCNGQGYHGEIQLYELLQTTEALKTAIAQGATPEKLTQAALQGQETASLSKALEFVYQEQTTLSELARLFPETLSTSLDCNITGLSEEVSKRLETVEQLLTTLTDEFNQLKQALHTKTSSPEVSASSPETALPAIANDEAFKETYIAETLPEDIDLSKETIAAGSGLYEELTDPGDWEELKRQLDPSQDTITADCLPEADSDSFRSIPDPWS